MNGRNWTRPYYGVQHYPEGQRYSVASFWATVTDYGTFATACIYTPGCGFSPLESRHTDAAAARSYAEQTLFALSRGEVGVSA